MKKKLKLSLKKNVISKLQARSVVGGTGQTDNASHYGCTCNGDVTMTCCVYSCTC